MLKEHSGKPGKIVRDSNSGFPFFTNDHVLKLTAVHLFIHNHSQIKELYNRRDMNKLMGVYGMSFIANTQIRLQTDGFKNGKPKQRKVLTFEDAYRHGGEAQDIRLDFDVFYPMRTRTVSAMPGLVNNILSIVFEGYKDSMFKNYSETFIHRGISDIERKVSSHKFHIGSDISEFDSISPENFIIEIINSMPFSDFERRLVLDLLYGPLYCPDVDGKGTRMISEDYNNATYSTWKGMPSGIFFTTVINCMQVVIARAWKMRSLFPDITNAKGFEDFLKHRLSYACLVMGDDGIDMAQDKSTLDYLFSESNDDILPIEPEDGFSFLGIRRYREGSLYRYCQSPISYVERLYIPEKSAGSFHRKYPVTGMKLRKDVYRDMPSFERIESIEHDLWKKIYNINLTEYVVTNSRYESNQMEDELSKIVLSNELSAVDKEVLIKPEKIHYKYSEEDIHPLVLKRLSERVSVEVFDKLKSVLKESA